MSEVPEKCANYTNRTYLTSPTEEPLNSPPIPTPLNATPEAGTVAWVDRPGFDEAVEAAAKAQWEADQVFTPWGLLPERSRERECKRAHPAVAAAYPVIAAAVLEEASEHLGAMFRKGDQPRGVLISAGEVASLARELTEGATE